MFLRVAYFVNQYPKVSHSFIRREILAVERQGFEVLRIALRGWNAEVVDLEDKQEQVRTMYVLKRGALALVFGMFGTLVASPWRFVSTLRLAM